MYQDDAKVSMGMVTRNAKLLWQVLTFAILVLCAASNVYSQCIPPAEMGITTSEADIMIPSMASFPDASVTPGAGWTNTGIGVVAGQQFNINLGGTINYWAKLNQSASFCANAYSPQTFYSGAASGDFIVVNLISGGGIVWIPQNSCSATCDDTNNSSTLFTNAQCNGSNGIGVDMYIAGSSIEGMGSYSVSSLASNTAYNHSFDPNYRQITTNGHGSFFNSNNQRGFYLQFTNGGNLETQAFDSCIQGNDQSSCSSSASCYGPGQCSSSSGRCSNCGCCYCDNLGAYTFNYTVLPASTNVSYTSSSFSGPAASGSNCAIGSVQAVITSDNPNVNSSASSGSFCVTQGAYSGYSNTSGTIWLRVYDTYYTDNVGNYYVQVTSPSVSYPIASFITKYVINPIKTQTWIAAQVMYQSLAGSSIFHRVALVAINLYIIVYAISFMYGLVQVSHLDLVKRIIKIGIILNLVNSNYSWTFFNQYLFSLFVNGSDYLISSITNLSTSVSTADFTVNSANLPVNYSTTGQGIFQSTGTAAGIQLFGFIDETFGQFFTSQVWTKLLSLIITPPAGVVYFVIILASMCVYILAVAEAVLAYIFSVVAIALMIAVAPVFIMCMLFEKTKEMFDNWIKYFLNFALQPVILFAGIMFVNKLVVVSFYQVLSFQSCWQCAINFYLNIPGIINQSLFCLPAFVAGPATGNSVNANILFYGIQAIGGFFMAIFVLGIMYYIFSKLMSQMCDFAPRITDMILGTVGAKTQLSGHGSIAGGMMKDFKDLVKSLTGMDNKSKARRQGAGGGGGGGGNGGGGAPRGGAGGSGIGAVGSGGGTGTK